MGVLSGMVRIGDIVGKNPEVQSIFESINKGSIGRRQYTNRLSVDPPLDPPRNMPLRPDLSEEGDFLYDEHREIWLAGRGERCLEPLD